MAFGESSPAYPAFVIVEPTSTINADTSSNERNQKINKQVRMLDIDDEVSLKLKIKTYLHSTS